MPKGKILITGGSGLVGVRLTRLLRQADYEVVHVSRSKNSKCGVRTYTWDLRKGKLEKGALQGVNSIIHLAGAGIADKKWSEARKQLIIDSRVQGIELLLREVKAQNIQLDSFISASGISAYGVTTTEDIKTETDSYGGDFPAHCVELWETEAKKFESLCRTALLRIGIVLSTQGGALAKLARPVEFGIGSALGDGKQYIPWISLEDLCRAFIFALEQPAFKGTYNVVGTEHVTNAGLTKAVAKQLKMPLLMPKVPAFVLRGLFGEMASLVLEGSRASNEKLTQAGFTLEHPDVASALQFIYKERI